jgi:hypothetical protein
MGMYCIEVKDADGSPRLLPYFDAHDDDFARRSSKLANLPDGSIIAGLLKQKKTIVGGEPVTYHIDIPL